MRQTEPTTITQGEAITWTKSFTNYPADEWTLQYRFRGIEGEGNGFNVDATADDTAFEASITATQSGNAQSGKYGWQAWVTNIASSDDVQMIAEGIVTIARGFAEDPTTAVDLRSNAKIALDAIDAALSGAATNDQLEYEISTPAGSRRVKRMSRSELVEVRRHYAAIVSRENEAARLKNGGRFGKPIKATMSNR